MKSENAVASEVRLEAGKQNILLMRNNSGAFIDNRGIPVRYGLGNVSKKVNKVTKSSDLIGITQVIITPDMVGKSIGVFTAVETKKEGWIFNPNNEAEVAQLNFIKIVQSHNGIGKFVSDARLLTF